MYRLARLPDPVLPAAPNEDLRDVLDVFGGLLDAIHETLQKRFQDPFPEDCQSWLIPYIADLIDVRLVSPHVAGRREEVAHGIDWRQRKGTLQGLVDIAEAIGRSGVVAHEGQRRVAITPRVGVPMPSAAALGVDPGAAREHTSPPPRQGRTRATCAERSAGQPVVTVDLRRHGFAVAVEQDTAVSQRTDFEKHLVLDLDDDRQPDPDLELHWQHQHCGGAPCFPGSFQDASVRTVDVREPDWRVGHHHPKRVLLHVPVPLGFHPDPQRTIEWEQVLEAIKAELQGQPAPPGSSTLLRVRIDTDPTGERTITVTGNPGQPLPSITTAGGGPIALSAFGASPVGAHMHRFERLIVEPGLELTSARLQLERVATPLLRMSGGSSHDLSARDCLLHDVALDPSTGRVRLEYCTLLGSIRSNVLEASDCIVWPGNPRAPDAWPPSLRLRFSAAPGLPLAADYLRDRSRTWWIHERTVTRRAPVFHANELFAPGCAVIHPATHPEIRFGAEDGGEMGAFHHRRHCLRAQAIQDKLQGFLPVGVQAVLIPDPHWETPVPVTHR